MKKIISSISAAALLTQSTCFAAAAESATPADIDKAAYNYILENSNYTIDKNRDNVITNEELAAAEYITVDLDGVDDISWLADMASCENLFLYNGTIKDFSILKEMPKLKSVSMGTVPITDLSFAKELDLEELSLSNMDQITTEQRIELLKADDVIIEEGFSKYVEIRPKNIFGLGNELNITIDNEDCTEIVPYGVSNYFINLYAAKPGTVNFHVYYEDVEIRTGTVTVTPSTAEDVPLHDTPLPELETFYSPYLKAPAVLKGDKIYKVGFDEVTLLHSDVAEYERAITPTGRQSYYDNDLILKKDGTLYVNDTVIEGQKFVDIEENYIISEDGHIYTVYNPDRKVTLMEIGDDFGSFPPYNDYFYINNEGELVRFQIDITDRIDDEIFTLTKENTGIFNPVQMNNSLILDEKGDVWLIEFRGKGVRKVAEGAVEIDEFYTEEEGTVDVYKTEDGVYHYWFDGTPVTKATEPYNNDYYIAQGGIPTFRYEGETAVDYYISNDNLLTVEANNGNSFAMTDVSDIMNLYKDSSTNYYYFYFVRTDNSLWRYNCQTDEYEEVIIPDSAVSPVTTTTKPATTTTTKPKTTTTKPATTTTTKPKTTTTNPATTTTTKPKTTTTKPATTTTKPKTTTTKPATTTTKPVTTAPKPVVSGDVNGDSKLTVADLVSLQNWLLGSKKSTISGNGADILNDGIIDVYDLICLRKEIIKSNEIK